MDYVICYVVASVKSRHKKIMLSFIVHMEMYLILDGMVEDHKHHNSESLDAS